MRDDGQSQHSAADGQAARADHAARTAAITLALALPADTVLYLLLPLHAATFGVSLPEVGILLAANRLVRIAGNGWVARFYSRGGPRIACLLAAVAAACTAFGYALLSGVWLLLAMRLLWGLSFSALNIANHALPTSEPTGAARRAGRARAIVAAGPMVGLMGGALLSEIYGPRLVFAVLGCAALIAPLFALRLPSTPEAYNAEPARWSWPTPISMWSFSMGFVLDGLFIFGLSLLAKATIPNGAAVAAGAAMALRYLAEILLSPASGAMAQRHGARWLLILLSLACSLALLLLGTGGMLLWVGVIATVMLRALIQPLPAPVIAEAYPGPSRVPALARQATWRDIGAGAGPLAAGLLFPIAPAAAIYLGAAVLLAGSSLLLLRKDT